ncbi:hypothetical protein HanRHA438_Chr05g0233931 [Helianthus annuus]|nr:hypothetical protein HanRHA438_Chr05g0233931 [Helianthus annuus]
MFYSVYAIQFLRKGFPNLTHSPPISAIFITFFFTIASIHLPHINSIWYQRFGHHNDIVFKLAFNGLVSCNEDKPYMLWNACI